MVTLLKRRGAKCGRRFGEHPGSVEHTRESWELHQRRPPDFQFVVHRNEPALPELAYEQSLQQLATSGNHRSFDWNLANALGRPGRLANECRERSSECDRQPPSG